MNRKQRRAASRSAPAAPDASPGRRLAIRPFVSPGEVFVHADGTTWERAPMQAFRTGDFIVIRIGRNAYYFDATSGEYDGPEAAVDPAIDQAALAAALEASAAERGGPPATPYFQPGSKGFAAEVAGWPRDPVSAPGSDEKN